MQEDWNQELQDGGPPVGEFSTSGKSQCRATVLQTLDVALLQQTCLSHARIRFQVILKALPRFGVKL